MRIERFVFVVCQMWMGKMQLGTVVDILLLSLL